MPLFDFGPADKDHLGKFTNVCKLVLCDKGTLRSMLQRAYVQIRSVSSQNLQYACWLACAFGYAICCVFVNHSKTASNLRAAADGIVCDRGIRPCCHSNSLLSLSDEVCRQST